MAQEVNLGGTIYISSKKAAEITGYTRDYIGQLARKGLIVAQRVSGLWYIVEESLRNYKSKADEFVPVPPPIIQKEPQIESSVSFDGKEYVSTQRAAEITAYHPDYVGQLARTGKILSRQIGNRWFVDREEVVEHKRHNDALLAAVQADSVGLMKIEPLAEPESVNDLHFNYMPEQPLEYLPPVANRRDDIEFNGISDDLSAPAEDATEIPIRVIRPATVARAPRPDVYFEESLDSYRGSRFVVGIIILTIVVVVSMGMLYLYMFNRSTLSMLYIKASNSVSAVAGALPAERLGIPDFILEFVTNELYYRRDSF